MARYISLLRGINVGGHKKISMQNLAKLYQALGLQKVRTYIQSGNVVFSSPSKDEEEIRKRIEAKIQKEFKMDVKVILRSDVEIKKVLDNNPFLKGNSDTSRLYVAFLSSFPKNPDLKELEKYKAKSEEFALHGKEIYMFFQDGYGKTKLTINLFEKKLSVVATARNWNTINKLYELAS